MKTDYTITKAVADVFGELPDTFHATDHQRGTGETNSRKLQPSQTL